MIFVVDTNILFSACVTPAGRIFEILFNVPPHTQLISSHYAIQELHYHRSKLVRVSGYTEQELDLVLSSVLKQIDFFAEELIEKSHWIEADRLTAGVDKKDIIFVALVLQTEGWLWTGDKKLSEHLKAMGFTRVLSTAEMYEKLEIG